MLTSCEWKSQCVQKVLPNVGVWLILYSKYIATQSNYTVALFINIVEVVAAQLKFLSA